VFWYQNGASYAKDTIEGKIGLPLFEKGSANE
jgi:hypothetical protein